MGIVLSPSKRPKVEQEDKVPVETPSPREDGYVLCLDLVSSRGRIRILGVEPVTLTLGANPTFQTRRHGTVPV